MTQRELDNILRQSWTKLIFDFLTEKGEDVGYVKDNIINLPTVDKDGNEKEIEITIKVPKGSVKDNEPYDLYGLREAYEINKKEKERKAKEKAEKKKKKIEKDIEFRKKQKEKRGN